MNKLLSTLGIVAMLLILPLRQFGQAPQFPQHQATIDFDITEIHTFDERVFFMHQLVNDSRFNVVNSEQDGVFIISVDPAYEGMDLAASFYDFREQNAHAFSMMDKEQAAETALAYKATLPEEITLSLMMDVYIKSRENDMCATAYPFCTDNGMYQFPAGVDSGNGESGPNYDCLTTTPNPAWYYMRIGNPGGISIYMFSTPERDIDFCCWGPFTDPVEPCPYGLTIDKRVSCSYSGNATETCHIPSYAQTGDYYILVITNYSNQPCNINFSKTGGDGTTDCGIMPPLVNNDGPFCMGDDIHFTANGQAGASYHWTGPNGFVSDLQNPSISNCNMSHAGTYTCTISLNGQTNSATTDVAVVAQPTANFTATTVCLGSPTQFTATCTTNPANQEISNYLWQFGDGETSNEQNPTHQFTTAGNHRVSLTVDCGQGTCSDTKMQDVMVNATPVANAGDNQTIPYGNTAQLHGSGGPGNYTYNYHWEPENMVVDANAQNTQTVVLTTEQTYRLTVTNPQGQCIDSDEITIFIQGEAMTASATASHSTICKGESTQLMVTAGGGTGIFTYSWTPTQGLSDPHSPNPIATPTEETTYQCHVSDGQTSEDVSVTITVNYSNQTLKHVNNQCDEYVWQFGWNGEEYHYFESTTETKTIDTYQGCDSTVTLNLKMDYRPTFDYIKGNSLVVGGSEFQYSVEKYYILPDPRSTHNTEWGLYDKDGQVFEQWEIEPFGIKNDSCMLYIYSFLRDSVELRVRTYPTGECYCEGDSLSIWIRCGYYDVNENSDQLRNVTVYPNPNDGNMMLSFENMTGDIRVRVYDLRGTLMDEINLNNTLERQTHTYQAKLPKGVYFLSITSKEGTLTKRVIIMN